MIQKDFFQRIDKKVGGESSNKKELKKSVQNSQDFINLNCVLLKIKIQKYTPKSILIKKENFNQRFGKRFQIEKKKIQPLDFYGNQLEGTVIMYLNQDYHPCCKRSSYQGGNQTLLKL